MIAVVLFLSQYSTFGSLGAAAKTERKECRAACGFGMPIKKIAGECKGKASPAIQVPGLAAIKDAVEEGADQENSRQLALAISSGCHDCSAGSSFRSAFVRVSD